MKVTEFHEKLNRVEGSAYVIEEEAAPVRGVYEAELIHDNVNEATVSVYTGPRLTGEKIENYALSTPSLAPWKRIIRVYADAPRVYISYETEGDTVEAEDVNRLQKAVSETQEAVNGETERAEEAERKLTKGLEAETARAETAERELAEGLTAETARAEDAERELAEGLTAEAARAEAAERKLTEGLTAEAARAEAAENALQQALDGGRPVWEDKYTRSEVDNKFSALETAIDWKETVNTYADLAAAYPSPQDGWTVNVRDTDYTYRWSGTKWTAISANAIPKATASVDGLLTKEDKVLYDDANAKKHAHANRSILDKLTQALLNAWNGAAAHLNRRDNPHSVTKAQVGLGNVENKTGAAIRAGLTKAEVTAALGYVPADQAYRHPDSTVTAGTYAKVTVNAQGHVTGGSNPTTLAGYGITDAVKKAPTWNDLMGV